VLPAVLNLGNHIFAIGWICQSKRLVLHAIAEYIKMGHTFETTESKLRATKLCFKNNIIPFSPGCFDRGPTVTYFAAALAPK